ncbi:MAG: hypothetical protein AAFW75_15950, partial [Cyanobacteria bacterium J06636_16]
MSHKAKNITTAPKIRSLLRYVGSNNTRQPEHNRKLKAGGIIPCQARLDPQQPSLRATLEDLLAQESALQAG